MKAMIFAAGKGTRLKPLTDHKPKALIEVNGKPLLGIIISRLKKCGFTDIIINVHHFAEQVVDYIQTYPDKEIHLSVSDETGELLDTGGGLKKASWFFNDNKPFLVHNVDVLSDIDLNDLFSFHVREKALATLAVKSRKTSRYLLFNQNGELSGWRNTDTGEEIKSKKTEKSVIPLAFSGIQIIDPVLFELMKKKSGIFPVIPVYVRLAGNHKLKAYRHDDSLWLDIGKKETLTEAGDLLRKIERLH